MIRILVVDDQALVRGGLAALLDLEPDLEVVGQAPDGETALRRAAELRPDVVLMDIEMPGLGGLEATRAVLEHSPATRVLIVTTFGRPGFLRRALASGAHGFLVKDAPARELADAVRRVHEGLRVVDPALAIASAVDGDSPLSPRETEVLRIAADGGTIAEIAERAHLSQGTIRNHLSAAIGKTGARNRADAVRIATDRGWL